MALSNKCFFHFIPPLYFNKVMTHFCGTKMNRILGIVGFYQDSILETTSIKDIYHTVSQHTISPLFKSHPFFFSTFSFKWSTMGSFYFFSFTSTTTHDSAWFNTMTPPLFEFTRRAPKCASLRTSLSKKKFPSLAFLVLLMNNFLRESTTTLPLPTWYMMLVS